MAWFDPLRIPFNGRRLGLSLGDANWEGRYLDEVRDRATQDGTCSYAVTWPSQRWLEQVARDAWRSRSNGADTAGSAGLDAWFPNRTYVWVRSKDLRTQAIRWYLAQHTDETDGGEPGGEWQPDFQEVRWLESLIARHERAWSTFFAIHGIEVVTVLYEEALTHPVETVAALLDRLGVTAATTISGSEVAPAPEESAAEAWLAPYRRVRSRLSSTVGVRAVGS